jgi:hypothetical protein
MNQGKTFLFAVWHLDSSKPEKTAKWKKPE